MPHATAGDVHVNGMTPGGKFARGNRRGTPRKKKEDRMGKPFAEISVASFEDGGGDYVEGPDGLFYFHASHNQKSHGSGGGKRGGGGRPADDDIKVAEAAAKKADGRYKAIRSRSNTARGSRGLRPGAVEQAAKEANDANRALDSARRIRRGPR